MRHFLRFQLNKTKEIIEHARSCSEHVPVFEQFYIGKYRNDGKNFTDEGKFPEIDDIDLEKIPPALILTVSNGVYFSSSGIPRDMDEDRRLRVVYAEGINPNKDDNISWTKTKIALTGDEQQVIAFPIVWFDNIRNTHFVEIWVEHNNKRITQYGIKS